MQILSDLGPYVAQAMTDSEALAALGAGQYDFVAVDVGLQDMSGVDLAHKARATSSSIEIVFASGQANITSIDRISGAQSATKPYSTESLAEAIGKAVLFRSK